MAASPIFILPISSPQLGHLSTRLSVPINIFSPEQLGHAPNKHLVNSDFLINFLVDSAA